MKPRQEEYIAGVDEVGKGALFGPVFAAAVMLRREKADKLIVAGLKDSKLITRKKRATLIPLIKNASLSWSLGQSSAREIDILGIRSATEMAMLRALQNLKGPISMVLVDGNLPIRTWEGAQQTIIHGDNLFPNIAAASVLAKEGRDDLIKRLAKKFPGYGLEKHSGYGTKFHCEALIELGPSKLHRKSFLTKLFLKAKR